MNAAMEAINASKTQAAPTLLDLIAVLAKEGSLEMDVHVQVDMKWKKKLHYSIKARTDAGRSTNLDC